MTATQTAGTPDYFVITGTVAGIAAFNAAVLAKRNLGYAPIGTPYTDGTNIEQVMFKGAVSSFIGQYPITGLFQVPQSGYQIVNVGGAKVGGSATGLANDATVYTASVVVDGGVAQPITVTGSAAQTYTTLVTELQADTVGATWAIVGGNLRLTSNSTGIHSTIAITAGTLFTGVFPTGFVAILTAVPGTSDDQFIVAGDQTADFNAGYRFTVLGSTGNDGTYTVDAGGSYALTGPNTAIPVKENIPSAVVDGNIQAYASSAAQVNSPH